jgi:hypothetical protein
MDAAGLWLHRALSLAAQQTRQQGASSSKGSKGSQTGVGGGRHGDHHHHLHPLQEELHFQLWGPLVGLGLPGEATSHFYYKVTGDNPPSPIQYAICGEWNIGQFFMIMLWTISKLLTKRGVSLVYYYYTIIIPPGQPRQMN